MDYQGFETLRDANGLRVFLVAGTPSPWGQAAKAMLEYKGIDCAYGAWIPGEANDELASWSGIHSGPVVAYNDEKPIDKWNDVLFLLERIAPKPSLIPEDALDRALMFGFSHEICGELGLGWNRRLSMFAPAMESGQAPEGIVRMSGKYNYNADDVAAASARVAATMKALTAQLETQHAKGSDYFIGDSLTALDFYWCAFSNLVEIMSWEKIPLAEDWRPLFVHDDKAVHGAHSDLLKAHRDRIFEAHFKNPMEF
ncbi:MAG: hypothetical protein AAF387_15600 [Pseudomonadota bacterium]